MSRLFLVVAGLTAALALVPLGASASHSTFVPYRFAATESAPTSVTGGVTNVWKLTLANKGRLIRKASITYFLYENAKIKSTSTRPYKLRLAGDGLDRIVSWQLGNLAGGKSRTIKVVVTPPPDFATTPTKGYCPEVDFKVNGAWLASRNKCSKYFPPPKPKG